MRLLAVLAALCALLAPAAAALAQDEDVEGTKEHPLEPPDTSSPRATFQSFLVDMNAAWKSYLQRRQEQRAGDGAAARHARRALRALDLSDVPPAQADDVGLQAAIQLLDVFNRIPFPSLHNVPDAKQMEAQELTRWVVPHTRISIARVEEGPRAGEWLFSAETVAGAREFYRRTRHLPLKRGAVVDDGYELFIAMPGWMIPLAWVEALPEWAREVYYEQTVWQWVLLTLLLALTAGAGTWAVRWSRRREAGQKPPPSRALVGPLALVALTYGVGYLVEAQLGLAGEVRLVLQLVFRMVFFATAAWTMMLLGGVVAALIIRSPRIELGSIDENMVRLGVRILSFVVAVLILVEGARSLGVPVMGVLAGLGVGGLAVALAAQSTIENFIGSLTIFADRPVRVGDFCRFGDQMGTVEEIGLRSTRLRTLDRSVLTVPNAEFSRLKLDNLTLRDRILFRATLNLRLETTADQLRLVLARLRELLVGHPAVDAEPARVRLVGVGPCSLDLEVFAYLRTNDYNQFLAMREDLFLRMMEIVEQAGTSFAPPAHTTYVAADRGMDEEGARRAEAQVEKWRRETALPFPEFAPEQREKLADTLDYPPAGSPPPRRSSEQVDG